MFVSWFLNTRIETLLDALANFLKEKGLREENTFFWVCDYVIRQTDVKADLAWLGDCVERRRAHGAANGAVARARPAHARLLHQRGLPHAQKSGAQFDVVMSSAQQAAFEKALVDGGFDSIETSLSKV